MLFWTAFRSSSARGHGKNCPVKIFEASLGYSYVEILGVLYFG